MTTTKPRTLALAALLSAATLASGCHHHRAGNNLKHQAAEDLNCTPKLVRLTPYGDRSAGQTVAQGCGRHALYSMTPEGPVLSSSIEADSMGPPMSAPPPTPQPVGPPPPPPAQP
jgi:hypothetical protein